MTTELDIVRAATPALSGPAAGSTAAAMDMLRGHAEVMQMAFDLASSMVKTSMVPTHFRLKAEDATAAILYGMELGLSPIQSLQQVIAVHGKPTVEARTMVGLLKAKGYRFKVHENTDTVATIQGWSPDGVEDETVTWTIEDAIKAEFVPQIDPDTGKYALNSNNKLKGNMKYLTQPRQMLYAKAAGELCRHLAPDALLGIAYSHEDLTSEPEPAPVRITSERVTPAAPVPGSDGPPVQQWQPPVSDATADAASEDDAKPDNPQVGESAKASPEPTAAPAADPPAEMATTAEQRALSDQLERHGHKTPAAKRAYLTADTGRKITSAKELHGFEARAITGVLTVLADPDQIATLRRALEADNVHAEGEQLDWIRNNGAPDLGDWNELEADRAVDLTSYLLGEQAEDAARTENSEQTALDTDGDAR